MDRGIIALISIGFVLLVASAWSSMLAPCSWFGCAPAKEIPSRCLGVQQ